MTTEPYRDRSKLRCPLCGSSQVHVFYEVLGVPASCNILWASKKEAISCPKGDIKLAYCPVCSFITNLAIKAEKNQYGQQYDNSLFYSQHFQNFAKKLLLQLVKRYGLRNKTIVEVGCGKVDFLSLFCTLGKNSGRRMDPAFFVSGTDGQNLASVAGSNSGYLEKADPKVDFVFSYHELEHVNNPKHFLKALRESIDYGLNARVWFAVPNAMKSFDEGDYTDIIYEHVSYFTIPSLSYLFSKCGFCVSETTESEKAIFDSIYIDAVPSKDSNELKPLSQKASNQIEERLKLFAGKSTKRISLHNESITEFLDKRKKVVIWGAGARGVNFLNMIKDSRIKYAVDINPRKQGMYVPGTGQKIVDPGFLRTYQPDFVILANPQYEKEIRQLLGNLGIGAGFILI